MLQELQDRGLTIDDESYQKYLSTDRYPELFRQIQRDLEGSRQSLIDLVTPALLPATGIPKTNTLYHLIHPLALRLISNYQL